MMLENVFGDTPQIRIIDFLLRNYPHDFPITQIVQMTKVSRKDILEILKGFEDYGLVESRTKRRTKYYILAKNERTSWLYEFTMFVYSWSLKTAELNKK